MKTLLRVLKFLGFILFSGMCIISLTMLLLIGVVPSVGVVAGALEVEHLNPWNPENIYVTILLCAGFATVAGIIAAYVMMYQKQDTPWVSWYISRLGGLMFFAFANFASLVVLLTFTTFAATMLTGHRYPEVTDTFRELPALYIVVTIIAAVIATGSILTAKRTEPHQEAQEA